MKKATDKKNRNRSRQAASRAIRSPVAQPAIVRWRYYLVCVFLVSLASVLVWKVASVQVMPRQDRGFEFLQRYGESQFVRSEEISANRGVIMDRNGEPLAVSTTVISICANPKVLLENKQRWADLASALKISPKRLADKINTYANKEFMYLSRHLAPEQANRILAGEIPGVFPRREYQRFYPAGEVAAHLVGVTNTDDVGQEGLELSYNEWLRGIPGSRQVMKDLKGRTIENLRLERAAQPGRDLVLSMDLRLQYLAYRALKKAVNRHKAVSGSVVILDSRTGEVLAMVNQPSYNPNNRARISTAAMKNRAVTDQFEPGSTMKPLTVTAALESGKYSPSTQIDTAPGYLRIPGKTVLDPVNYGVLDVTHVIAESSQVGITKIALDLKPDRVRDVFHRLGLGQSAGIGLPGESSGSLPNHQKWHPVERATLAYGYGVTVTTLQLAHAYTVFANEGMLMPLSVLKQDRDKVRETGEQVIDPRHAHQVMGMLAEVMEPGGTGVRARLESYSAGGKTGTARKASQGGYLEEAKFSVFTGVAPVENPRIVVAIMINEPRDGLYGGGEVAAPVFSEVAESALRILQVPPDRLDSKQFTSRKKTGEPLS